MPNVLFIILISILTLCISFVSVKGTLSNLTHTKRWWKIITQRGWIAIGLTLAIIGLLIWQNNNSEKVSSHKDAELKKEREKSDSIISSKVDSSRKVLFNDLSEALANQNMRLDTVKKSLDIIKSIKNEVPVIIKEPSSEFDLCIPDGFELKEVNGVTYRFQIKYCNYYSTSKNIDIWTYILFKDIQDSIRYIDRVKNLPKNFEALAGDMAFYPFPINFETNPKEIYIVLIGNYTSTSNTKKTINKMYTYSLRDKRLGIPSDVTDGKVRAVLKEGDFNK
jgi:hypothetical protein